MMGMDNKDQKHHLESIEACNIDFFNVQARSCRPACFQQFRIDYLYRVRYGVVRSHPCYLVAGFTLVGCAGRYDALEVCGISNIDTKYTAIGIG